MQTDSLLFLDKWRDLASRMTGLSAKDDIFENRSTWNARPFSWIHEKTETEIHKYLLVFGWESRMARFGFSFSKPADPLRCSVLSANLALFSFIYLFSYISLYSTFFVREGGISSFLSLSLSSFFPPSLSLSLLFPRLFSTFHLHLVGGQSTWSGMSDFFTLKKIILILINTVMA